MGVAFLDRHKLKLGRAVGGTFIALVMVTTMAACSFGRATPTRTPFPTWTPTPQGQQPAGEQPAAVPVVQVPADSTNTLAPPTPEPPTPEPPTPEPPTLEPPTAIPADTPTPEPLPTDTPAEPPTPEPSATSAFSFALEAAEKLPTDSLAVNVVRIYLYAYSEADFGLPGYTLQVSHNGAPLAVDEVTDAGVPEQTRSYASPFTRYTNMSVVFVEPQAGRWEMQLLDLSRAPVGPPVAFDLTADELTRELYVRYRQE